MYRIGRWAFEAGVWSHCAAFWALGFGMLAAIQASSALPPGARHNLTISHYIRTLIGHPRPCFSLDAQHRSHEAGISLLARRRN